MVPFDILQSNRQPLHNSSLVDRQEQIYNGSEPPPGVAYHSLQGARRHIKRGTPFEGRLFERVEQGNTAVKRDPRTRRGLAIELGRPPVILANAGDLKSMSVERRYSEKEIAAIFKQATEAQDAARRQASDGEGLTLAELQHIGKDAGITSEFIARAAASIERDVPTPTPRTYLGSTISVHRVVDLPGPLSDDDWDRLVVDLRETFHAPGIVRRDGSLRQWRNGNLHVLVEPSESGHRLSLRTLNGNMRSALGTGLALFTMGILLILLLAVSGDFAVEVGSTLAVSSFAAMGLASMGYAAYRLPRWAKERTGQMDAIASRVAARMDERSTMSPRETDTSDHLDLSAPAESVDDAMVQRPKRTRT